MELHWFTSISSCLDLHNTAATWCHHLSSPHKLSLCCSQLWQKSPVDLLPSDSWNKHRKSVDRDPLAKSLCFCSCLEHNSSSQRWRLKKIEFSAQRMAMTCVTHLEAFCALGHVSCHFCLLSLDWEFGFVNCSLRTWQRHYPKPKLHLQRPRSWSRRRPCPPSHRKLFPLRHREEDVFSGLYCCPWAP